TCNEPGRNLDQNVHTLIIVEKPGISGFFVPNTGHLFIVSRHKYNLPVIGHSFLNEFSEFLFYRIGIDHMPVSSVFIGF
ncbi:MAG: hypothetical protein ACN4A7_01375, partial [Thermacetogeniaceae bacterium]